MKAPGLGADAAGGRVSGCVAPRVLRVHCTAPSISQPGADLGGLRRGVRALRGVKPPPGSTHRATGHRLRSFRKCFLAFFLLARAGWSAPEIRWVRVFMPVPGDEGGPVATRAGAAKKSRSTRNALARSRPDQSPSLPESRPSSMTGGASSRLRLPPPAGAAAAALRTLHRCPYASPWEISDTAPAPTFTPRSSTRYAYTQPPGGGGQRWSSHARDLPPSNFHNTESRAPGGAGRAAVGVSTRTLVAK